VKISVFSSREEIGAAAAQRARSSIREAITESGRANIILATGSSQFEVFDHLIAAAGDVDWSKVTMFHLDEYIGLPATHPASFRKYLKERFVDRVPTLGEAVFVDGEAADPCAECQRLGERIRAESVCVAFLGIGENGHLAFNDPPADFETDEPYLVVELDQTCRHQQVGEGWFGSLDEVPREAISMGIRQILKSRELIVSVPDTRKAEAVRAAVEGPVTNMCPASILREHPRCHLFLDNDSASLLSR